MLEGTSSRSTRHRRSGSPPIWSRSLSRKVAINAVHGRLPTGAPSVGDRPRWKRCAPTSSTSMACLATTMPVGPVLICNGPGTRAAGLNSGVKRSSGRATEPTSPSARAVQLVVRKHRRRPARRCRSSHARKPGQAHVLLRRRRGRLSVHTVVGQPRLRHRRQHGHGVRRRGATVHHRSVGAPTRTSWPTPSLLASARLHHPKLVLGFRLHPRRRAGTRAGVQRCRLGP